MLAPHSLPLSLPLHPPTRIADVAVYSANCGVAELFVNGALVGMGPGRRVNQTQGVDAIEVTAAIVASGANAVGLQGFHTDRYSGSHPRLLLQLRLTLVDGTQQLVSTGKGWHTFDADQAFGPTSSTGAWAGGRCAGPDCSGMPQEDIDMQRYPVGWTRPGFAAGPEWQPGSPAPPFVLPLANRPARPIAMYTRRATTVTPSTAAGCRSCYVIDYGLEMQGGVELTLAAATAGHQVIVVLSEELAPDGTPLVPMHTGNNFTARWTLAAGTQTVAQHEYMEFRYAMIINASAAPRLADCNAWVVRYPLGDSADDTYGDKPALPPSPLRRPAALATFSSDRADLNAVWTIVRHTLVACGGLDVNVDSNTRQRDFCATDAYVTGLGQLSISNDYGIPSMTTQNGFQIDSNIWQGMTDFRSALISLAHASALYSGDVSVIRQRWEDIKKHSFVYYFDESIGAVNKPKAFMGSQNCK